MKKLLIAACVIPLLTGCWETSNGEKIGIIVKLAKEGMIIKTQEGELIRGGMSSASGTVGKSFHFTVENQSMLPIIEQAMNEQKQVKIKYHQEFATLWRTETGDNTFVDQVEIIQ